MNINQCLKVIGNPAKLSILQWLSDPAQHFAELCQEGAINFSNNSVCVGLIQKKSGLSQPATSQYLSQLEQAGLVKSTRQGNWTYYARDEQGIKDFLAELTTHLGIRL